MIPDGAHLPPAHFSAVDGFAESELASATRAKRASRRNFDFDRRQDCTASVYLLHALLQAHDFLDFTTRVNHKLRETTLLTICMDASLGDIDIDLGWYRLAFPHPLQALKTIQNAMDLLIHVVSVTEE